MLFYKDIRAGVVSHITDDADNVLYTNNNQACVYYITQIVFSNNLSSAQTSVDIGVTACLFFMHMHFETVAN